MPGFLDAFDHVVVLMLENRSFDNLLGYLYGPAEVPRGQEFEGVTERVLSNLAPGDVERPPGGGIKVGRNPGTFESMQWPNPDPGEELPHVNTQLFDEFSPSTNRFRPVQDLDPPFNAPPGDFPCARAPSPSMGGFVNDYVSSFKIQAGRLPTLAEYEIIMRCFTPNADTGVPVISQLARSFAVCDHWHCAVPSQTFCNRSFFNSGSSSGFVINGLDRDDYGKWPRRNTQETIFNRLEKHGRSWRVYYDVEDPFPLTLLIHHEPLKAFAKSHFCSMDTFYRDVHEGTLPDYAFVEPRLFLNHNDEHPPGVTTGSEHSSVLAGEILIKDIYDAIRQSANARGSHAENTLLGITFDEHGGCYDHVPPPCATPPTSGEPVGEMGFRFDRLGVRVPTVLVASCIEAGTVVNTPLQHTSMIRTLSEKWTLGHLTERDRTAPVISGVFGGVRRPGRDWPEVDARPYYPGRSLNHDHALNQLQKSLLRTFTALVGERSDPHRDDVGTVGDALSFMGEKREALFR